MNKDRTEIMSVQEFRSRTMKKQLRPASWKWEDVHPKLMNSLENSESGRGAVSLVHKDTGDQAGVSPSLNVIVQVFKPGERDHAHKHSNVALFLVFQGKGFSIVDGEKIKWEKGDLVLAPAWSEHEHCNDSETEDAILITFQNVPQMSNLRTWFFEEPVGSEPKHIVGEEKDEFST